MSILARLRNAWTGFRADAGFEIPAPDSDYWYQGLGFRSAAGTYVSPETAMRLAAVFACVRVISETIGSLPIAIYRRRPDGGKERANDHPMYDVLQRPNVWQTGFEFWEMLQAHLELRGNGYAQIVSGNGRTIDQLIPLHPDRVRVFRLPTGRLRYEVTAYFTGEVTKLNQEEMFHLRGMSSDGIVGISTISAASEVVGMALAQQEYGSRFFSNDARPSMVLEVPTKLNPEAREVLKKTWMEAHTGANAHKPAVLEGGLQAKSLGLTNKDSQLIEARQASRTDIASMFRLPPHKIGDLTRGTFSNIEQQNIEFATDSIRPRVVRLERRINADLIDPLRVGDANAEFFADFNMDALFRGDMKSRYEAYNQALQYWLTVNEVRRMENLNPVDGGDEILRPVNMMPADAAPPDTANDAGQNAQDAGTDDSTADSGDAEARNSRLRPLAMSAAARLVSREVKELRRIAERNMESDGRNREFVYFYKTHLKYVQENLVLSKTSAKSYVDANCNLLTSARTDALNSVIDRIEEDSPPLLAELAMKD